MMRKMWMLFILTMASSKAEESKVNFSDGKESRFLSLFAVGGDGRPPPPPQQPGHGHTIASFHGGRCASRLETALDQIKRRQLSKARHEEAPVQMINLNGYSLQQHMRSAPVDMYVTRMRVRLPQNQNWVRIERCFFDPRNVSLETRLLFSDLTISGSVNLLDGNDELDKTVDLREYDRDTFYDKRDFQGRIRFRSDDDEDDDRLRSRNDYYGRGRRDCNMILRLRKAGIGFFTQPLNQSPGRFSVKTDSEFIEPGFISVYAYGCEKYISQRRNYDRNYHDDDYRNQLERRQKRQVDEFRFEPYAYDDQDTHYGRSIRHWERKGINHRLEKSKLFGDDEQLDDLDDISREMEDIFTKGIRSLLTTYMQKELQPAIKETLMRNLGYTLSYGR